MINLLEAYSLRGMSRVVLALALVGSAACGGSEPPAKSPEAAAEAPEESTRHVEMSAEIGGLSEEKVDRAFQRALSGLQQCLEEGAQRVEFLGGSVSFFLKIDAEGKVDHAHLEKSTLGDRDTEKCMLESVSRKRWPKPVGGLHGLARKSFDFDPPNDVRAPTAWDASHISDAIAKLSKKVSGCKNGHRGTFEATLYVAANGSVIAAGVTPPDEAGESEVDCLAGTLKSATLPSPGSWPAKVTFSL